MRYKDENYRINNKPKNSKAGNSKARDSKYQNSKINYYKINKRALGEEYEKIAGNILRNLDMKLLNIITDVIMGK